MKFNLIEVSGNWNGNITYTFPPAGCTRSRFSMQNISIEELERNLNQNIPMELQETVILYLNN